mgnify:CR=1 FL=1
MSNYVQVFTYIDSRKKTKHMAIYNDSRDEALREFNINKEPEDKLCSERTLTVDAYKEWRKSL